MSEVIGAFKILRQEGESIRFACAVNGKLVTFFPFTPIEDGLDDIFTRGMTIGRQIFDFNEDEIKAVKAVFNRYENLMQDYYNIVVNEWIYPYSKRSLDGLLELDLLPFEIAKIQKCLDQLTFIYLIKDNASGLIKIGRSNDPTKRLNQLKKQNTLLPSENDFHLLTFWQDHPYIESVLHELFNEKRVRGEWFRLNSEDIQDIGKYYFKK